MTRRRSLSGALLAFALGTLVATADVGAQQARHLPTLPPGAADTVPGDTIPPDTVRADTIRADTAAADTVPADTVRTPRERALDRLRALPTTPVQRTAEDADEGDEADEMGEPGEDAGDQESSIVVRRRAWTEDDQGRVLLESEVRALLTNLEGYVITEYKGDAAVFESADNRLRLTGENRVAREGFAIETDSLLVYSGETGIVCGYGNPILSGDQDPVESDRVCYDMGRGLGMAHGARTQFVQGGTWYVRGPENRVFLLNGDERSELYGDRVQFTSCDLPEPHYVFQAQSLKMVHEDVMVARNVTLRFEDVPVFWLPWMVQSMKPDRRSGLLTPQFGMNDIVRNSDGYNRRISNVGFYWAVSDYVSALIAGEWFSNNYTAMEGSVSYNWLRQFLQGRLAVKQYWQHAEFGTGRREMSISTNNSWQPDERTRVQLSGDYSTSTSLVRDYSFDATELNRQIASNASINREFAWGSMSLGASRRQQITDDQINWTLPSLNMSLRPLTLYSNEEGTQNLTWSGRAQTERRLREVNHELTPRAQDQNVVTASGSHSVSFGRLSLNQSVDFRDQTLGEQSPQIEDPLAEVSDQEIRWTTALSFQQNLWAGTTLSPQISIQGRQIRDDRTEGDYLAEPNRISAGASVGTSLFGFWPGFGQYERIRHKISPSLNWAYSPAPRTTAMQDSIFGLRDLRERNRIGLSFNQTFEAKVDESRENGNGRNGRTGESAENGAPAEGTGEARNGNDAANGAEVGTENGAQVETENGAEVDRTGEPRRLPQARIVNVLSINTSTTFEYDFVRAREEGRGFMTEEVSNSLRSDLVPGFQLGMTHSLFERGVASEDGALEPRTFSPFLTRLNASFSIDNDFWLFRRLGIGAAGNGDPGGTAGPARRDDYADDYDDEIDLDHRDASRGSMVPRGGRPAMGGMGPGGGWQASVNYSLDRQRPGVAGVPGMPLRETQQIVNGSLRFSPTEHWGVSWNTSYSFTARAFDSHTLTLTRDLHRWQASFDFIKAPNGNFAMQFRVHLLDNPDIKVDYDQRTTAADRLREAQP
jgi:hypothetical protein